MLKSDLKKSNNAEEYICNINIIKIIFLQYRVSMAEWLARRTLKLLSPVWVRILPMHLNLDQPSQVNISR